MSDVEVVQSLYAAMEVRDVGRMLELIDADCVITHDPALPWGGRYGGSDGMAAFARRLTQAIDSVVAIEAIFAAAGEVIQFGRVRGTVRATGVPFDVPEMHRWTVRQGKVVAGHLTVDTALMLEALAAKP